jgi:uncharacterized protein
MTGPADRAPFPPASAHLDTYLRGLTEGRLLLQRCGGCGQARLPRPRCAACGSAAAEWIQASGRGEVWARCTFHKVYGPAYRDQVPYDVVTIRLEEGALLVSNLVGVAPGEVGIGTAVVAHTAMGDDGVPIVRFRPES